MQVDLVYAEEHFGHHTIPVWNALPEEFKGQIYTGMGPIPQGRNVALVASYRDYKRALTANRQIVMMEHGVGQTLRKPDGSLLEHPSYAGAERKNCILLICPGPSAADAYRESGTDVPIVEVGCPKLDPWVGFQPIREDDRPVVAMSFHWDALIAPEIRSAWPEYLGLPGREQVIELAKRYKVLGHGHPRIFNKLRPMWAALGIEPVPSFFEVLRRADLYVADSTSTIYEFAYTGRPVVLLNSFRYRRDVHHGLRFWNASHVGVHCDHSSKLLQAVSTALAGLPGMAEARADALTYAYSHVDGNASQRAADAIVQALSSFMDG